VRAPPLPVTGFLGALAYAGVVATFTPFTWPMRVAVALPMVSVVAAAVARGWHRQGSLEAAPVRTTGLATGLVLLALVGVFELALYVSAPRDEYPTMSSIAGEALGAWPVRAAAFLTWLGAGWYVVRR